MSRGGDYDLREQLRFWFWISSRMDRPISDVFLYLLSSLVSRLLEFLRVCLAPFGPDGNEKCLENACNWRGKQCAPDAKELTTCNQGSQRDNGMEPNRFPHDARPYNVTFYDMHKHEVSQHNDRQEPSFCQRKKHTDGPGDQRAQDRDELQDEREHPEQERIVHP